MNNTDTHIWSLSLAAPAYNEAASLEAVVKGWVSYFRAHKIICSFEIVICNDGSKDNTREILERLSSEFPEVKPVHHVVNQGAAAALTTAINNSTMDWVLLTDSDGQFPIENLENFLKIQATDSSRAFIGARVKKSDGWFARFGSYASGQVCNWIHGTKYRDFNCAFKLVGGPELRSLRLEAKGLNYSTEITSKLLESGVQLREIAVTHSNRLKGKSSLKALRDALHRMLFVAYIAIRQLLFRMKVLQSQKVASP